MKRRPATSDLLGRAGAGVEQLAHSRVVVLQDSDHERRLGRLLL